jgi:Putative transposase
MSAGVEITCRVYKPPRLVSISVIGPKATALYEVMKGNLETLYGAIGDGAIAARIPKHARKELEAYLDCGLLCRGFACLKCEDCGERRRLAQDGALLGRLTRIAVETVLTFYAARAGQEGLLRAKSGAVTAVQRTSSDLRLNPHLHMIALDSAWREEDGELAWEGLGHLRTSEVGEVLERVVRRMERHLRRSGQFRAFEDEDEADREDDPEGNLAASAVYGQAPPAGPQWVSRLAPLEPQALAYDKPLCASLDGFTLHAATRAGALDPAGREALLRYVLRPPVAQERVEQRPDGLVRITLKKAYTDGTIAVDMDPLSLLCRLATSVPPPRLHTLRYAGVLAPASAWRSRLAPQSAPAAAAGDKPSRPDHAGGYRPWAELLARTFDHGINCSSHRGSDRPGSRHSPLSPAARARAGRPRPRRPVG